MIDLFSAFAAGAAFVNVLWCAKEGRPGVMAFNLVFCVLNACLALT